MTYEEAEAFAEGFGYTIGIWNDERTFMAGYKDMGGTNGVSLSVWLDRETFEFKYYDGIIVITSGEVGAFGDIIQFLKWQATFMETVQDLMAGRKLRGGI